MEHWLRDNDRRLSAQAFVLLATGRTSSRARMASFTAESHRWQGGAGCERTASRPAPSPPETGTVIRWPRR